MRKVVLLRIDGLQRGLVGRIGALIVQHVGGIYGMLFRHWAARGSPLRNAYAMNCNELWRRVVQVQ